MSVRLYWCTKFIICVTINPTLSLLYQGGENEICPFPLDGGRLVWGDFKIVCLGIPAFAGMTKELKDP
jgi:hypothetical protein